MYDWIVKDNESEVNEITLNTASCSMVIRSTEKVNLKTGKRQLLGEPKKVGEQNTLDGIPSYFNYER